MMKILSIDQAYIAISYSNIEPRTRFGDFGANDNLSCKIFAFIKFI